MRRSAVGERLQKKAEAAADLFVAIAEQAEDLALHLGVVDADRTAAELDTVEHAVVVLRSQRERIARQRLLAHRRSGEWVMRRGEPAGLRIALEQREIQHPQERELRLVAQAA